MNKAKRFIRRRRAISLAVLALLLTYSVRSYMVEREINNLHNLPGGAAQLPDVGSYVELCGFVASVLDVNLTRFDERKHYRMVLRAKNGNVLVVGSFRIGPSLDLQSALIKGTVERNLFGLGGKYVDATFVEIK